MSPNRFSVFSEEFAERVRTALSLDLPYAERPPSELVEGSKPASTLALFAEKQGRVHLLITRRTETVERHKGQMAFPGGMADPEDLGNGVVTALRETEEEVGILRPQIQVLGRLPDLWTVTSFHITPVVGRLLVPVEQISIESSQHEIAEVLWIPLEQLEDPTVYRLETRRLGQIDYPVHFFQIGPNPIWGATGAMIRNLLDRLKRVP